MREPVCRYYAILRSVLRREDRQELRRPGDHQHCQLRHRSMMQTPLHHCYGWPATLLFLTAEYLLLPHLCHRYTYPGNQKEHSDFSRLQFRAAVLQVLLHPLDFRFPIQPHKYDLLVNRSVASGSVHSPITSSHFVRMSDIRSHDLSYLSAQMHIEQEFCTQNQFLVELQLLTPPYNTEHIQGVRVQGQREGP